MGSRSELLAKLRGVLHSNFSGLSIGDDHPQYARRNAPIITGGMTIACPAVITGDCTNALLVRSTALLNVFEVDTTNNEIHLLGASASAGGVTLGTNTLRAGYAFYMNHQKAFGIESSSGPGNPLIYASAGLDQILFGAETTTAFQQNVFEASALFNAGFAHKRTVVTTTTTLDSQGRVTYVAVEEPRASGIVVTLPQAIAGFGVGAKPGQIVIVGDEGLVAGSGFPFTVIGNGGALIAGSALARNFVENGHVETYITDGTDWFFGA